MTVKSFIPLIHGVNFINILRAAFEQADPERAKKTDNITAVFFTLLESVPVKAALRMLLKLTHGYKRIHGNNFQIIDTFL